ncbi:hypothetical protein [Vibrio harveyi]|uniref:hypothetical protein n=1 Tax=Vibrio harveyi TaxID=669 RepID=UPI001263B16C|nr:hypothetical protein [Vibrio harveyi]QFQ77561.1 hypothetical protein F9277_09160 [Vibrio harveyi]
MTPLNQTQYHLELILAIYNLIPYNKKVTAKQIQAQLAPLGLTRSLRTIQRNLSVIGAIFANVIVDDRDKPFGYKKTQELTLSTTAHEAVLLCWLIQSAKHQLPNSLSPLLEDFLSSITPENTKDLQCHWVTKIHVTKTSEAAMSSFRFELQIDTKQLAFDAQRLFDATVTPPDFNTKCPS